MTEQLIAGVAGGLVGAGVLAILILVRSSETTNVDPRSECDECSAPMQMVFPPDLHGGNFFRCDNGHVWQEHVRFGVASLERREHLDKLDRDLRLLTFFDEQAPVTPALRTTILKIAGKPAHVRRELARLASEDAKPA